MPPKPPKPKKSKGVFARIRAWNAKRNAEKTKRYNKSHKKRVKDSKSGK